MRIISDLDMETLPFVINVGLRLADIIFAHSDTIFDTVPMIIY